MNPQRVLDLFPTIVTILLVSAGAHALPEDAEQDIHVRYLSTELFLDEGLVVHIGSQAEPACINQGSLEICGVEIRLEQTDGGGLGKVTATGSPARFKQQPAADQAIVNASGRTLTFDNVAQIVTADGDAEFSQAGTVLTHQLIEYNIDTGRAKASGDGDEPGRMIVPPRATPN